jgi:phosphohistidine swiveling domain-containing protein
MIKLSTKAETLISLKDKLSVAEVLPLIYFTVRQWEEEKENIWIKVSQNLPGNEFIVRSSALNEDTIDASQAGKFESVGHISGKENFFNAVNKVINSFDDNNPGNQVLVQPMLKNVKICGVAFTADPNTFGNYYVINYDVSGSTSSITSGISEAGRGSRLLYVFKGKENASLEDGMYKVCQALSGLEKLFCQNSLDVEFAINSSGKLFILQVRALCIKESLTDYEKQKQELERIEIKIKDTQHPKPFLCGQKTIYGVMPDWNPAEIIGIRPKPLALSLYREMVTDNIWAYQRDNYGYRNLRGFPLMVSFCGLPYIDIRVSFNSFIPASLDEKISEKLVDYYIDRLEDDPSKHDKVEFDIVFSCYTLDLPERIKVLRGYGFTDGEIQKVTDALRNVTNGIIDHKNGLWRQDYAKIHILEKRYAAIMDSSIPDIEKIYWLLEDCKRYGTLPFAGLARAAFIAVQMLQSMVNIGILSSKEYQEFMNDVNTVSSNMGTDFSSLSKEDFLEKYGHLRPGTYDINSPRYDEEPDMYFEWSKENNDKSTSKELFRLTLDQLGGLENALKKNGLNNNVLELMDFIKNVIEGREYGKFIFTRNLSKAIQMSGNLGKPYGIPREDFAYIDIHTILDMYTSPKDMGDVFQAAVENGKKNYNITKTIDLPPIIMEPSNIWYFYCPDTEPNYITLGNVRAETAVMENVQHDCSIEGKILLIPSADPGYDWIFSHGIKGFITMYGGANSHMAIRAGELGIPAVIGVGEKKFMEYKTAAVLEINCLGKTVKIIRKGK